MSSADSRLKRSAHHTKDDKAAIHPLGSEKQRLFLRVQQYCCEQTSTTALSDIAKQYIAAHQPLISRYRLLFHHQADVPTWCEHSRDFDTQLQHHINNFSWWLRSYSYMPSSRYKEFSYKLLRPLPAGANMFDAMQEQDVDLHDAYIMDTNGDGSPTFAIYREMQELAPSIIRRVLRNRVMELTNEEERSAIREELSKKRKRACEQIDRDMK